MWRPIATAPRDHTAFIALGDEEIALVWWEPEADSKWKIMSIPGRGIRVSSTLDIVFHSWRNSFDFRIVLNKEQHPEYYMVPSEIEARTKAGVLSLAEEDKHRRYRSRK